jgi:hypothetical protein
MLSMAAIPLLLLGAIGPGLFDHRIFPDRE